MCHSVNTPVKNAIKVVDYAELEDYLKQFDDRTLVLNFWATWCVPCVKELPYFEQITRTYSKDEVVVVLVSLDFTNQINKRLKPFIEDNKLQSTILVLDDPDQNTWIDQVDPRWSGAIPATIIRKGEQATFHEGAFSSFDKLNTIIQSF